MGAVLADNNYIFNEHKQMEALIAKKNKWMEALKVYWSPNGDPRVHASNLRIQIQKLKQTKIKAFNDGLGKHKLMILLNCC